MISKKMSAIANLGTIIVKKGMKSTKDSLLGALMKAGKEDFLEAKKEPPVQTKHVRSELANQLAEFIKNFLTGGKTDLNVAYRMANRTGILINDISLTRSLE